MGPHFNPLCTVAFLLEDVTDRYMQRFEPRAAALAEAEIMYAHLERIESNFASLEPLLPAVSVTPLRNERVESGATRSRRERPASQP